MLLLPLELLPVLEDLAAAGNRHIPEHVGVAVDELFTDPVGYRVQVEAAGLLLHPGVKNHLEQHIPQLFPQMLRVVLVDGLSGLVGLLQEITANRVVILFPVPGAAPGLAQDADDLHQVPYTVRILILEIYHTSLPSASYFFTKTLRAAKFSQFSRLLASGTGHLWK